jgi:hypothetical protein
MGAANNRTIEGEPPRHRAVHHPDFVVTVSSGNRGAGGINTLGSPSTAKKTRSASAATTSRSQQPFIDCSWDGMAACSSRRPRIEPGPVFGAGRTKPDIMTFIYASAAVGGEVMAID